MAAIFILIAFSLFLATGFLLAFYWAVKDGQYEDDVTPSIRILYENSEKQSKAIPPVSTPEP